MTPTRAAGRKPVPVSHHPANVRTIKPATQPVAGRATGRPAAPRKPK